MVTLVALEETDNEELKFVVDTVEDAVVKDDEIVLADAIFVVDVVLLPLVDADV